VEVGCADSTRLDALEPILANIRKVLALTQPSFFELGRVAEISGARFRKSAFRQGYRSILHCHITPGPEKKTLRVCRREPQGL
jgi:hypothetical protein